MKDLAYIFSDPKHETFRMPCISKLCKNSFAHKAYEYGFEKCTIWYIIWNQSNVRKFQSVCNTKMAARIDKSLSNLWDSLKIVDEIKFKINVQIMFINEI